MPTTHKRSLLAQLLTLLCLALLGLTLCTIVGSALTSSDNAQKTLLAAQSLLAFAAPALIFWWLQGDRRFFVPNVPRQTPIWLCAIVVLPLALPAVNLTKWLNDMLVLPDFMGAIEQWMRQMEDAAAALTERLLKMHNLGDLCINLFVFALLPAIGEELFFRGALQRTLAQHTNPHAAIWVTALIFSAIHLQFYGFVPRWLLGAALGYLYWIGNSIWVNIAAHFINNCMAVIAAYVAFDNCLDTIGTGDTWWLGVLSLAVCTLLLNLTAHTTKQKNRCKPSLPPDFSNKTTERRP